MYCHNFHSVEGVDFSLSYHSFSVNDGNGTIDTVAVKPLVSVHIPLARAASIPIEVVLINQWSLDGEPEHEDVWKAGLWLEGSLFYATFETDIVIEQVSARTLSARGQIAVRIDGQWQGDPWQKWGDDYAHNFNFDWPTGSRRSPEGTPWRPFR